MCDGVEFGVDAIRVEMLAKEASLMEKGLSLKVSDLPLGETIQRLGAVNNHHKQDKVSQSQQSRHRYVICTRIFEFSRITRVVVV